ALRFARAALALRGAAQSQDGQLRVAAAVVLGAGLAALVMAARSDAPVSEPALAAVLATVCVLQTVMLLSREPAMFLQPRPLGLWPFRAGVIALTAVALFRP